MRQGQHKNRSRGRGRRQSGGGGGNSANRVYESNGPDVKVRGTAQTVADKYTQLARDAQSSGDSVMAESYLQFAEHYFRIVSATQSAQPQPSKREQQPGEAPESEAAAAGEEAPATAAEAAAKSDPASESQPDVVAEDATEPGWGETPQFLKRPVEGAAPAKQRRTRTPRPKKTAAAPEASDDADKTPDLNGSGSAPETGEEAVVQSKPVNIPAPEPVENAAAES